MLVAIYSLFKIQKSQTTQDKILYPDTDQLFKLYIVSPFQKSAKCKSTHVFQQTQGFRQIEFGITNPTTIFPSCLIFGLKGSQWFQGL